MSKPWRFVPKNAGCWVDGSHLSADGFDVQVITFAEINGWNCGKWEIDEILDARKVDERDGDNYPVWSEPLFDAAQDAVDWLNAQRTDDLVWTVEDNSLYLTKGNDDV